jgi:hypothetical protein
MPLLLTQPHRKRRRRMQRTKTKRTTMRKKLQHHHEGRTHHPVLRLPGVVDLPSGEDVEVAG